MRQAAATIYLVTNLVNGKTYVGLTRFDINKRWREHRYHAKSGLKTHFYSAVRKYGAENFSILPIASCLNVADAGIVERNVIKSQRPEYNQTNGGEFTVGRHMPREAVERVIAKNTGLKRTPEQNRRMSEIKKRQYVDRPELKARSTSIIKTARAFVNEDKHRAAASKSAQERVWSGESRAKLSASCTGRRYGPEVINKTRLQNQKPVECITLGVTFDSILEASAHLHISNSAIGRACAGIRQKTAGGMWFQLV